jgi:hypothetical protein
MPLSLWCGRRESASDCAASTFAYRSGLDKKDETGVNMIFVAIVCHHTPYQGAGDAR